MSEIPLPTNPNTSLSPSPPLKKKKRREQQQIPPGSMSIKSAADVIPSDPLPRKNTDFSAFYRSLSLRRAEISEQWSRQLQLKGYPEEKNNNNNKNISIKEREEMKYGRLELEWFWGNQNSFRWNRSCFIWRKAVFQSMGTSEGVRDSLRLRSDTKQTNT